MNLILVEPADLSSDKRRVFLSGEHAQHVREVLKKGEGDTLRIGVVDGPTGTGTIAKADREIALDCEWGEVPPPPTRELILAVPRPKVLRRLWAQLSALGVRHIHLVNAAKVERFYFDSHVIAPETYRPLLLEGLQQAVDTHLPRVSIHRAFRPFVEDALPNIATRWMLDPAASERLGTGGSQPLLLAIGPEGGWNDFERGLLQAQGFEGRSMGRRVLRSDTACVAALAITSAS